MDEGARSLEVFLDVQRGLPRQGPGRDTSTREALALCRGLPERSAVLDVGCGPGMQTLVLAEALDGPITAVDLHQEYLDALTARVEAAGLAGRIEIVAGDMNDLPFPRQSFDLIWAEGSAYLMGVDKALAAWRRFLKPDGFAALTELVWLRPEPPAEVADFFAAEYPDMKDVAANVEIMESCGYAPSGHFTLPDAAWWEHYYTPLEAKLPALAEKYADDEMALGVVETTRREIDMRRRYPDWYGYEFLVGRVGGGGRSETGS